MGVYKGYGFAVCDCYAFHLKQIFINDSFPQSLMDAVYSLKHFLGDLEVSKQLLEQVVSRGDHIKKQIAERLSNKGIGAEIHFVGSSEPSRLTCVIDPVTPDNRYPCDFDCVVLIDKTLARNEQERILNTFFEGVSAKRITLGNYKRKPALQFWYDKFPVSVMLLDEQEYQRVAPCQYALTCSALTSEQVTTARALRLFCMRNGLYGGFTRGFKGIALENITRTHGDIENCLDWLYNTTPEQIFVSSPLDQSNLVGKIQQDIWLRLYAALDKYTSKGNIRSIPYGFESWNEDHLSMLTARFMSEDSDPHKIYKIAETLISSVADDLGASNDSHAILVIPQYQSNDVMVALSGLTHDSRSKFLSLFYSKRSELKKKQK